MENINTVYSNTEVIEKFVYEITTTDFSEILKTSTTEIEEEVSDIIDSTDLSTRFIENTLVISEVQQRVFLPYNINTVKDILLNDPQGYSSLQGVINKIYTRSIDYYRFSAISRFKEAYKLVREREKGSKVKALGLAFELFLNYNLHPAIITACKSLDELDVYLACLEDNTLENIKAINKAPERINDVIDENLHYSKLINPKNIEINLLDPKHDDNDEEVVNLSFTALENYNECPFKYKLSNELGFTIKSKKEIDDGIFIHSALEIINKKIIANNNEYIGDEEVIKTVELLFEKANLKFKEEKPEKYEVKLETITKDVLRYYNEVGCDLEIFDSEYPFYIKDKDYAFSGIVDLIYEKDGKLGILDYKNTSLVGQKYLDKYKKQLHFYVMALRDENNEFKGCEIEEIQIYAIKYKKGDRLFSFEIDDDYIEELKEELKTTAKKIKNKEFKPNHEDCTDCPYQMICK